MDTFEVVLSTAVIDYVDSGGSGPTVVLLHGLLMDSSLWDAVIPELAPDLRCIAPTLPMGAHRTPTRPGQDLSLPGLARLVVEFLDRLDLQDVTLIGNDTGGALVQLVAAAGAGRVGRLGLLSCEAFDNLPPGLTGRTLALTSHLSPALFGTFMQQLRLKPIRRLPISFGWLTRRGDATVAGWIRPLLGSASLRRDTVAMLRAVFADPQVLMAAADELRYFTRPALVIWARDDRVMPAEHGRRLAALLPDSTLLEIADSHTLLPLDQPLAVGRAIRDFVGAARANGAS